MTTTTMTMTVTTTMKTMTTNAGGNRARRLALVGLLLALPVAAILLVGVAAPGGAADATLSDFRSVDAPASAKPMPRLVGSARVTVARISFDVSAPASVSVVVRDAEGAVVRQLGHYSVPSRQRLVLSWNGRDDGGRVLQTGRYAAVVSAQGRLRRAVVRTEFDVLRSGAGSVG